MNRTEHLLTCLSEECAEVIKEISKANRFGLTDSYPPNTIMNKTKISTEYIELIAVYDMLVEEGILDRPADDQKIYSDKQDRVLKFMEYAKTKGTLT